MGRDYVSAAGMRGTVEETQVPFGRWLQRQRRALDLTQEELAQKIGCAPVTVHKIETGERRPSKQFLDRLAMVLSLPEAEQPAFVAYARSAFPDTLRQPRDVAPRSLESAPWQTGPHGAASHNLPLQLTSFVGREREIVEVKQLLAGRRLVTLTGSGGAGKTRLALRVTEELRLEFPDGVWWVDLARLSEPGLVLQAVAAALRFREEVARPLFDQLAGYLQDRQLLLLLDNCEHLIEACARLADSLLRGAPELKILATSREALAIAGETTYRVPSLKVPDPQQLPLLAALVQFEAVQLFADRGMAALPSFSITEANAPVVVEICRHLDGIPLAIELAAARVKLLTLEQIRDRLADRFHLLTAGSRVALPRHKTLRATVDWSYSLLSEPERALLRRLAVFAGGWTLEAAEGVCAGEGIAQDEIFDLLAHLVDKSLVAPGWQGATGRYGMLETMRQYGWERLAERGEAEQFRRSHARFFLVYAQQVEARSRVKARHAWLQRLQDEHNNLRAALAWMAESGESAAGLQLSGALWRFWEERGYTTEARTWLAQMLDLAGPDVDALMRAQALLGAGVCAYYQSDYRAANALCAESLRLCREQGDLRGQAWSLMYLGYVATDSGEPERGRGLLEESLALCRESGDRHGAAWALTLLALALFFLNEPVIARPLVEEALTISRDIGDRWCTAHALHVAADVHMELGDWASARACEEASIAIWQELGDRRHLAYSLMIFGLVCVRAGDGPRARPYVQQSLGLFREVGDQWGVFAGLTVAAVQAAAETEWPRALQLAGAAAALGEAVGGGLPAGVQAFVWQSLAQALESLHAEAASEAWRRGRSMPVDQAIAMALV
jgi:predicted ATPase/DNA-binding XRE family transcriptional regulator